ncbi:ATP-binding cassette sub-family G member 1-like isoform X1 [Ostrinia furnacalis]|uniref:ATP-binding cassette sub-family G member 1-like isoform X1 n=1 Tax=Ostrinia furnacalis TaxID=93504 RepID=UPI0010389CE9|nr:ATP-binding cassette sub-family G member 1-like isoform X1 [Ostrinia furnacalis]
MDMEAAKDDLSFEDGKLVVFTDIVCRVPQASMGISWKWKKRESCKNEYIILNEACGAIRPGRLTYILGPSGAGKTTLMKILAGRKKVGVKGAMYGAGRNAVMVSQHATLIDTLTAGETLQFAARLKLPNVKPWDRTQLIANISKQLGILDIHTTRAGHLSGGERKRLTIACELLVDPTVMLLDEPTSGLDSVSSMSVARALLTVARSGRTVACVIHQPSSQLFNCADDVILLSGGRTLYSGALADIPDALSKAGFQCPQYYNMADYMLEIATEEHSGNLALLEAEAKSYAHEMRRIAKSDVHEENLKGVVVETEALLNTRQPLTEGYLANVPQQLGALLWRCWIGAMRDVHLTQIRLAAHLLVALLLGALYNGAGADAGRVISNTGCLFFFLLFIFFSNAMPPIHTFPVEASVVLQEHLNKWYSLPAYCASKILVDLPIQLLCATVFMFPAWYLTSQPLDAHRMGLAWLLCALLTILAQTFGLVVGAACDVKLGLFVIPAANIPMLMFSEFFIPYREIPVYLRPFAAISYFRYAFDAFLETVYGFDRGRLPCHDEIFCLFADPTKYLKHLGLTRNLYSDFSALVIWIVILQISLICILKYRVHRACR